jgi:uncharacterized protein with HEPN domain
VKDDRMFLHHILDAVSRVEGFTVGGPADFTESPMVQDAVLRNLEVIGEAVKNLSAGLRETHPEVPWSRIAGLRDVLIHQYFGVDLDAVWNVVENRLPELKRAVTAILAGG